MSSRAFTPRIFHLDNLELNLSAGVPGIGNLVISWYVLVSHKTAMQRPFGIPSRLPAD